ncbi:hypothetical protein H6G97_50665 [Nostoc flagelliforme FACHB-838]|uniref:Transposase n=1 Tax=Nostoc flagelliforme FACHB-838 TaxID=2692904 RepID=A0ABR8E8V2_9NOSO|nr:hypothetical protein [Nostoc flagelliforme]MBD2537028.1 hypothetical protein [Nostoc flagelliforme FACHB-838]
MAVYWRTYYWCLCRGCPRCRSSAVGYDLYMVWIAVIVAVCRGHIKKPVKHPFL